MRLSNASVLGVSILLCAILTPGEARAQRRGIPIPIFFGLGEEITPVGELPAAVRAEARSQLNSDVSIGFHYKRFHVFWVSLWTWNGQHVLYNGDRYWIPDPADWQRLLGSSESRSLGTPILYRFPLGLDLLGGLVVIGFLWSRAFPSDQERVRRLLTDVRYQEALNCYLGRIKRGETADASAAARRTSPEAAFADAVQALRDRGIPADQADTDMRVILRAMIEQSRRVQTP